ncbi:uncharacterized protein LOC131018769 [Salvia miltiorrhiza]|uniref:uncharacterized protein LOC131018769 n=1 Tax=Salvia miltiorrhiza TaxID=226208 RepID=UPI0025ACD875|nr:uncharacterized protein LOC131018769 [Salvia miltiorrhiza]
MKKLVTPKLVTPKLVTPSLELVHHAQYVEQLQHIKVLYTSSLSNNSTIAQTSLDQWSTSQKKLYSSYFDFHLVNTIIPLFEMVYALCGCKLDEVFAILNDPSYVCRTRMLSMEKYLLTVGSIGSVCAIGYVRAFLEKFEQLPESYGKKTFDFCEQRGLKLFMEFTGLTKRFAAKGKTDNPKKDLGKGATADEGKDVGNSALEKDLGKGAALDEGKDVGNSALEKDLGKGAAPDEGKDVENSALEKYLGKGAAVDEGTDVGKSTVDAAETVRVLLEKKNNNGGIKVVVNIFTAVVGNNISN